MTSTRARGDAKAWMALHDWGVLALPHNGILSIYEQDKEQHRQWARAIDQMLRDGTELPGHMYMWRTATRRWHEQSPTFR